MKKHFSFPALIGTYAVAMLLFACLCPGDDLGNGCIFQIIVLWLSTEAWDLLFFLPIALIARKANKINDAVDARKIARWTSPAILVAPLFLYLIFGVADAYLAGKVSRVLGYGDLPLLFKASYASVALFFVASHFCRILPLSIFATFKEDA